MPHCPEKIKKNNPLHFQNQRYIGIFLSQREKGGGERRGEREREIERKRERKSAGDYISKPPGPK